MLYYAIHRSNVCPAPDHELVQGGPAGGPTPRAPPEPSPKGKGHLYLAGDIIAQKYRLTRVLGEGGMGAVWLARNMKLDVDVAIKLIRRELANPGGPRRLLQEARAAARIGHRFIVRVFDFGETELDDPFIVMEVLSGESLRDVLDRKEPPARGERRRDAAPHRERARRGPRERHRPPRSQARERHARAGRPGGMVPKLVDFGIAKRSTAATRATVTTTGRRLVVGTPDYMSPEQAGGREEVDEGADVWALAVILYEAITGHVPFCRARYNAAHLLDHDGDPRPLPRAAGRRRAALGHPARAALAKRGSSGPDHARLRHGPRRVGHRAGIESDIAGTSLAAHWMSTGITGSPFSVAPPGMHADRMTAPDVVIPKAAPLPGAMSMATQRKKRGSVSPSACLVATLIGVVLWVARTPSSTSAAQAAGPSTTAPAPAPSPPAATAITPTASASTDAAGGDALRDGARAGAPSGQARLEEASQRRAADREGAQLLALTPRRRLREARVVRVGLRPHDDDGAGGGARDAVGGGAAEQPLPARGLGRVATTMTSAPISRASWTTARSGPARCGSASP